MGHDFHYISTDGLPVQAPWRWTPVPDWESPDIIAANERYRRAAPWESGRYSCGYAHSARIAQALLNTGVLVNMEPAGPAPARGHWYVDEDSDERVLTPEGRAYLSQDAGEPFRVPSFKFSSSDGWIFTPSECLWMAYALKPHPEPDMRAFGRFCEVAASHGGFTAD